MRKACYWDNCCEEVSASRVGCEFKKHLCTIGISSSKDLRFVDGNQSLYML